jgi:hypothetical protein
LEVGVVSSFSCLFLYNVEKKGIKNGREQLSSSFRCPRQCFFNSFPLMCFVRKKKSTRCWCATYPTL